MKKFFKSLLKWFLIIIFGTVGFVYGFSLLFPRVYNVLETKALGIEEDSVVTIVQEKDSITKNLAKNDTIKWKQIDSPKLSIKLEHEDDCYIVPVKVNGIPMKMMLDTGASNMTISIIEYEFLKRHGLLSEKYVDETECSVADGSTVKAYTIKISEVEIGGEIIKDVECVVMPQTDAPSLLGMNVLKKFGNIKIDYKRHYLILED